MKQPLSSLTIALHESMAVIEANLMCIWGFIYHDHGISKSQLDSVTVLSQRTNYPFLALILISFTLF